MDRLHLEIVIDLTNERRQQCRISCRSTIARKVDAVVSAAVLLEIAVQSFQVPCIEEQAISALTA